MPHSVDGRRHMVSMLGEGAQRVRNVRAAGGRAVLRGGVRQDVVLEEVPPGSRAAILQAYLRRTPGARPHMPVDKDAPLPDFDKIAGAVSRLPRDGSARDRLTAPQDRRGAHESSRSEFSIACNSPRPCQRPGARAPAGRPRL
jgi:hypothetical protein